jgi:hypothetical protein
MSEAQLTTDRKTICHLAEDRGGGPSRVRRTGPGAGVLRIDFEPEVAEGLALITWDDFFAKFFRARLGFLYQDRTEDGSVSRFHKFVDRH